MKLFVGFLLSLIIVFSTSAQYQRTTLVPAYGVAQPDPFGNAEVLEAIRRLEMRLDKMGNTGGQPTQGGLPPWLITMNNKCATCHGDGAKKGGVTFLQNGAPTQDLNGELAIEIIRQVANTDMPKGNGKYDDKEFGDLINGLADYFVAQRKRR